MPATLRINAPLIEIFSSLQGEGVMIGLRQVFIRFAECNLACDYCDTPFHAEPLFSVETKPGSGTFASHENPADLNEITRLIVDWQSNYNKVHHSVALTGGEPLLHADILRNWLPDISPVLPIYLETNGTLPGELTKILSLVDMISMDIKGASTSGMITPWDLHAEFMTLGAGKLCQVKFVVDKSTSAAELLQAGDLVERHAPDCPLVLQPRTLSTGLSLDGMSLLKFQQVAAKAHHDVRIIPQIHPWLGIS